MLAIVFCFTASDRILFTVRFEHDAMQIVHMAESPARHRRNYKLVNDSKQEISKSGMHNLLYYHFF
tara:strand:- start:39 stop:236 length:198 start_codon:yes stop_codon:yes gene_type:complete